MVHLPLQENQTKTKKDNEAGGATSV